MINYTEHIIGYQGKDLSLLFTFAAHIYSLGWRKRVVKSLEAFKTLDESAIRMSKARFLKEFSKFMPFNNATLDMAPFSDQVKKMMQEIWQELCFFWF